jgi:hypothetical protein
MSENTRGYWAFLYWYSFGIQKTPISIGFISFFLCYLVTLDIVCAAQFLGRSAKIVCFFTHVLQTSHNIYNTGSSH